MSQGQGVQGNYITKIIFYFVRTGTSTTMNSKSGPYNITTKACVTSWHHNVRCESFDSTTNIFNYQIRFTANRAKHSQQDIICSTDCLPPNPYEPPFSLDYSSCAPIPVKGKSLSLSSLSLSLLSLSLLSLSLSLSLVLSIFLDACLPNYLYVRPLCLSVSISNH